MPLYKMDFKDEEEWNLVAVKRAWVSDWLYKIYAFRIWPGQNLIPPWLQPFRWIFNKEVKEPLVKGDVK